jgi:hypothetical protein
LSVLSYLLSVAAASITLLIVIDMLRRNRLRERHAGWWLVGGGLALSVSLFPRILDAVAGVIGIEVPTNLVFFVSIALLVLVCIQHSAELTKIESQVRTLTEAIALVEKRVRDIESSPRR